MEIDRYRDVVNRLAVDKVNSRFSNKGPEHASVVVDAMFRNATSSIKLYTGQLNTAFYTSDNVFEALRSFLQDKKGSLCILSERTPDAEAVEKIKALTADTHLSLHVLNKTTQALPLGHFMTADNMSYRLELNDEAREAVVNFNEPLIATTLNKLFDTHLENHSAAL